MFSVILAVLVGLLGWLFYAGTRRPRNFPPGPPRWPVVGSLFSMFPIEKGQPSLLSTHEHFRKTYGKIHSMYVGNDAVVFVSDYEIMSELFKQDDAQGRAPFRPYNRLRPGAEDRKDDGCPGIIGSSEREWQEQRRFALRQLREFGFGKSSMEETFAEEIRKLCALYRRDAAEGKPVDLHLTVNISIVNALWSILVGETFEDLEDPKLREVAHRIDEMLSKFGPMSPASIIVPDKLFKYPFFNHLTGWKTSSECINGLLSVIKPQVDRHEATYDANDMRDFMDVYLRNIKECNDPSSSFYKSNGVDSLLNTMLDFFIAGSDTTSTSLIWAVLYMIQHPEIQTAVQEELDRVCGRDSMPTLTSQDDLPYTSAVISEMLRKTSLAFMGVPHQALSDLKAGGYDLPRGTIVFQNLYHIHHDPDYWKDPERFEPTRFLDPSTGRYRPDPRLHPFGVGKRYCLGQSLAEKEFFLFFSGLLHSFRFARVPGETLPGYGLNASHPMNVVRSCPKYRVILTDRMAEA